MKGLKSILAISLLLLSAPLCFSQSADALFGQAEALLEGIEQDQIQLQAELETALSLQGELKEDWAQSMIQIKELESSLSLATLESESLKLGLDQSTKRMKELNLQLAEALKGAGLQRKKLNSLESSLGIYKKLTIGLAISTASLGILSAILLIN